MIDKSAVKKFYIAVAIIKALGIAFALCAAAVLVYILNE